jgi:hypothetical protein
MESSGIRARFDYPHVNMVDHFNDLSEDLVSCFFEFIEHIPCKIVMPFPKWTKLRLSDADTPRRRPSDTYPRTLLPFQSEVFQRPLDLSFGIDQKVST